MAAIDVIEISPEAKALGKARSRPSYPAASWTIEVTDRELAQRIYLRWLSQGRAKGRKAREAWRSRFFQKCLMFARRRQAFGA